MKMSVNKYPALFACFLVSLTMTGQQKDTSHYVFRDFPLIKHAHPWLTSVNPAGLSTYQNRSISVGEVGWSYGRGDFVDYYQSHRTMKAGAQVESFYRLNHRCSLYGSMSYANRSEYDMAGSAFIDPTRNPFDIIEDSLTNLGKKHLDAYNLIGAFGIDLHRGVSLGAKVDYTTANYAKYKDLRHKSNYLNLTFHSGITVPLGKHFTLGGGYMYRRNIESLIFSTYVQIVKPYKSLVAYAAHTGQIEQFGNYGFTDKTRHQPLFNEYQGGNFQIEAHSGNIAFFNEMEISRRKGFYGKDSPYSIIYTSHRSRLYNYSGILTFSGAKSLHRFAFHMNIENLENKKNTYKELHNENKSSYYKYYDPIKTANKVWIDCHLNYTAYLGIDGELPVWTLNAGADMLNRKQTAYLFPFYRRQDLRNIEPFVRAERNILFKKSMLSVAVGASCRKGWGEVFQDFHFSTPSDKQKGVDTMEPYLYREYSVLTSPQYSLRATLKYSFIIPHAHFPIYLKAAFDYRHAAKPSAEMSHDHRTNIRICAGCVF